MLGLAAVPVKKSAWIAFKNERELRTTGKPFLDRL